MIINTIKNKTDIKLNIFFSSSNKYVFVKLESFYSKQIFSISTSSVLFKGINNRSSIIIVKLIGLICNKILCNKDTSTFHFNKINVKYNNKINFFFTQIIKKFIL